MISTGIFGSNVSPGLITPLLSRSKYVTTVTDPTPGYNVRCNGSEVTTHPLVVVTSKVYVPSAVIITSSGKDVPDCMTTPSCNKL